jgi:hypothetical protein
VSPVIARDARTKIEKINFPNLEINNLFCCIIS